MMDLMLGMRRMGLSLDTKFTAMQGQLGDLKSELATFNAQIVTKEVFQSLEVRVSKLEAEGAPTSEVSWLQSQVGRLDPANKSLCLRGFKEDDAPARTKGIESILESIRSKRTAHSCGARLEGSSGPTLGFRHIYRGVV